MYTECPNCHTFFKVTPAHLKVAGGKVRCGNCSEVFSALESLMEEVPASALERGKAKSGSKSSVAKEYDRDVEILEDKEESFADIEVPGISDLSDLDDSSLSGLAGDNASLNQSGSSLSDLSDLTAQTGLDVESIISTMETEQKNELSDLAGLDFNSSIVSNLDSKNVESRLQSATEQPDLSEINRDIDNALDGLFDEDEDIDLDLKTKPVSTRSTEDASKLLEDSDLTDLPDIYDENALPELDLQKEDRDKSSLNEFELDLSDEPDSHLESKPSSRKSVAKKNVSEALDDFELGDDILSSERLDIEDSDWSPNANGGESSEMYSGDSFILEELEDEKSSQSKGSFSKVFWVTLIFILLVVLGGQFIYLKRESLVKYPQMAAILDIECQIIGSFIPCDVPPKRALNEIELVDRNIVSHPRAENALLITTTIKNNADFDQPYPDMVLTFSDINQKVVARRMFKPEEYLAKDVVIADGMKAGVPIKVILEIVDPGEEAVNFQFDFK